MLDAREPKDKREGLLAETLWSLGLFMAVAAIIVLLSVIGPGHYPSGRRERRLAFPTRDRTIWRSEGRHRLERGAAADARGPATSEGLPRDNGGFQPCRYLQLLEE